MQIEVSKSELAGALSALGKLISRTSPVEAYRSLRIEGKENKITFQTVSVDEAVTYTLPVEDAGEFAVVVNFDEFRTIVRASRNKTLVLEYEQDKFGVDHCLMRTVNAEWPTEPVECGEYEGSHLPEKFVGSLAALVSENNGSTECKKIKKFFVRLSMENPAQSLFEKIWQKCGISYLKRLFSAGIGNNGKKISGT